jgi:hypothetical protein
MTEKVGSRSLLKIKEAGDLALLSLMRHEEHFRDMG